MNHIVDTRPLTEFEGGRNLLHESDDDTVIRLESTASDCSSREMNKWRPTDTVGMLPEALTETRNLSGTSVYCVCRGLNVLTAALNCVQAYIDSTVSCSQTY